MTTNGLTSFAYKAFIGPGAGPPRAGAGPGPGRGGARGRCFTWTCQLSPPPIVLKHAFFDRLLCVELSAWAVTNASMGTAIKMIYYKN